MHTDLYTQGELKTRQPRSSRCGKHWKVYNHSWAKKKLKNMKIEKEARAKITADKFDRGSRHTQTSDEIFRIAKAKVKTYILEMKPHKPLDPEQWAAVEYAMSQARDNKQCLMLIHGKWGTGKTRTINAIRYGLKCMGNDCVCTAIWISLLHQLSSLHENSAVYVKTERRDGLM